MQLNQDEYLLLSRRGSVPPAQGRGRHGPGAEPEEEEGQKRSGLPRRVRRRRPLAGLVRAALAPRRARLQPSRRDGFRDR